MTDANFEQWRGQYNDAPEECEDNACTGCPWCDAAQATTVAAPEESVLDTMFDWHGGQGSALYAAASCWLGGHEVSRETAERALAELERCAFQPNFTADNAEALDMLRAHVEGEV